MTNEQTMTLVLKDAAGNYFLVSQETLEQGRVPEEHRAEVGRLVAEASTSEAGEGNDTQGHEQTSMRPHVPPLTPLGYHLLMIRILESIQRNPYGRTPS